ncbi:response regulator [Parvularcula marina]|uniref:Sensory/regulatory protein RpfC n=1 Tax=Parvularcula marina TaxID=2292771 RepID=A0A371RID0_9PROT|nr:response regulator [Parvularcula marina]RFB05209.1 response regulator [Parvularcula marina]
MSPPNAVLDRIALFAILIDDENRIRFLNAALRDTTSLSEGDPFSPTDLPIDTRLVQGPTAKSNHFTTAMQIRNQSRLVEWSPSQFSDGEILLIGKDVTSDRRSYATLRELARSAADASQSKMRFLATMSHEMRTPLNGILGMNGLLLDTELDSNQRTYAEAVRQSGTALLGLINDILDYSKIEAGRLDLEEHWFDPANLLQGVTELLSPRAAEKGLEIAAYVAPDVPKRLYGDEGRLRQVLLNLAGNGVKFTESGGISLELRASPAEKPGSMRLKFDIRDTGIGISQEHITSIFEEFSQGDSGSARKHEGTGLGLTIAQQIVNAMGGTISVESETGKGSIFGFEIFLNAEKSKTIDDLPPHDDVTVVVATNQPFLKHILGLQLEAIGVGKVLFADTAADALDHLSRNPSATLFCDLSIAATDGPKLAGASPHSIVLLSPLARGRLDAFRQAGFDGYLIKPIRQSSLAERLSRTTSQSITSRPQRLDTTEVNPMPSTPNRLRVLLAEDNQINSVLAQAILKRAGHHVDVAANGREALDTFALAPYDLVLMDMRMPEMDGLEATRRLRDSGATLPIIALTANAMAADRQECFDAGMDDFVSKPFEPQELLNMLIKWTSGDAEDRREDAAAS